MSAFQGGRQSGFFGGGSLVWRGGMNNPTLLLTAPLLEGGSGQTAPPSPAVFSNSAVQTAMQTLQTDLKNDVPSGAKPTHASVGALQDDLDAIRQGTLSGTAASTKIQADQAAILTSMGLTQAQVTQIQSDQQALQTAITAAASDEHEPVAARLRPGPRRPPRPRPVHHRLFRRPCRRCRRTFKPTRPAARHISHEAVGHGAG